MIIQVIRQKCEFQTKYCNYLTVPKMVFSSYVCEAIYYPHNKWDRKKIISDLYDKKNNDDDAENVVIL